VIPHGTAQPSFSGTKAASPPEQTSPSTRRLLAVFLPQLSCELAQRQHTSPQTRTPCVETDPRLRSRDAPRAIVLIDTLSNELDGKTELNAVNFAAHQLGIRPHQMLAHARASVDGLVVQSLLRSEVRSALAHLAETLLRFGSPVSFRAPDTIWVDITGSSHLYGSEQELSLEVLAQVKSMGHAARVAVAPGPWLARAFAQHLPMGPMGTLHVSAGQAERRVSELPIMALPVQQEAVTWFARLGLLNIEDIRKLPSTSLAARLEGQVLEGSLGDVLELLQGRDNGILVPHHPEDAPREELFWEDPLEASEPLLFILKGLAARLSARLEGRGQAAHELLLTLYYDRSIAALAADPTGGRRLTSKEAPATHAKSLSFKLATPLFHADDLERVMRLRLQRQELLAPVVGLSLQASAVTEAHHSQMNLSETAAWRCGVSTDARALTVLLAELSAEIGAESIGRISSQDSHLLEKSSCLQPVSTAELMRSAVSSSTAVSLSTAVLEPDPRSLQPFHRQHLSAPENISPEPDELCLPQLPTRLIQPAIEIHAPIRKSELWVIGERAYVVQDVRFEQRLESVEWWECTRVFRDYFRVWLVCASSRFASPVAHRSSGGPSPHPSRDVSGLEVLVYRDRERGKSYLQALFD
jgi:protein ImuB